MSDIPCSLSARERSTLRRMCRGRTVTEAGALLGGSTVEMAGVAQFIWSIDKHIGYSGSTLNRYMSNLDRAGVRHKVQPIVADVLDQLTYWPAEVAFIDLTGAYELTFRALMLARANVLLVHDLCRVNCAGVERAIRDARLSVIEHTDTLAVCVR